MESEIHPISITLSEGQAQSQAVAPIPLATGEPLSDEAIEQILALLPPLEGQSGDQLEFKVPADPIPPPRPGNTLQETFPPAPVEMPPALVESGPLEVLRFAPEGEIEIAPFISVTFSQPMVAISTLDQLAAKGVPVQVDPSMPGTWRWLGTRVLTFEYDSAVIDRLPKATEYRVTIPAGTKSINGGELRETVQWSFTTPPPRVTSAYPAYEPQGREPLFFIHFDQRINPQAVLETIQVTAAGRPQRLALADEASLQANEQIKAQLKNAIEGRWLAFRALDPLPLDSEVVVSVGPGTPSAEGPLTTTQTYSYGFRTYAPLRVVEHGCSWGSDPCRPLYPFYIRFNNPIDSKVYQDSMLRIDPPLPGASVSVMGDTLSIQGQSKGQTTYTVILSPTIQDIFGQQLGSEVMLTFKVGPAEPVLYGPGQNFITLDPAARPVFSVYTINYSTLDVKIYAVRPGDWPAYKTYLQEFQRTDITPVIPGRKVLDKSLPVEAGADSLSEFNIDLTPMMDGPYGHFIVIISPPRDILRQNPDRVWQTVQAWVQVTQIGLDAFNDHSEMVLWATGLKDGAPLQGVTVTAQPGGQQATTGADGVARIPIPDGASYLVSSLGADQALLPRSSYFWGDDYWFTRPVYDMLRWYVFDDRHMYRPGEEIHLKGWLRAVGGKQDGDVGLVGSRLSGVHYQINDPLGNEIGSGSTTTNALGGFDFAFTLPEQANLGYFQMILMPEGDLSGYDSQPYYHSFEVQEFRRPEFEVTARNESSGPYFAGGSAVLAVEAKYYAGGALPGADVTWQVTSTPGSYSPPNWPDFTFGEWSPWWWSDMYYAESLIVGEKGYPGGPYGPGGVTETFTGQTDANGEHYLKLDFSQSNQTRPLSVMAESTVMDVNRQAWTGSTSLLVHPASLYIGIRSERYFVELGTPLRIDFIVTDLDGNPVADRPVEIRAARLEWKFRQGEWKEEAVDEQVCASGSQSQPVTCTFETPVGGTYRITATVNDSQGRQNQSQFTRWVSGGKTPQSRKVERESANLIPDKETYQPGDVAQILVQSPFSPAEGLLSVNRSGLLYTQRFYIEEGTATLSIPIQEEYLPGLYLQVDLTGSATRLDDQGNPVPGVAPRPAYATGTLSLKISTLQRSLSLEVAADPDALEPGGETFVDVLVKDAAGQPVPNAELAVVVVDEAILALSNYQMQDPLAAFYSDRWQDWNSIYSRSAIILANPQTMAQNQRDSGMADGMAKEESKLLSAAQPTMAVAMEAPAMAAPAEAAQPQPIRTRINFNPLAVFAPAVTTDENGRARVQVKLPDNLTRYRIMVAAVEDGRRFGKGEANLTARLPLMVRPSPPRFLNFGDRFELPVILQNQTGETLNVNVVVQATNLELTGPSGLLVSVPAHDRIEVRFPAAAQMAGQARIQIAALSADGENFSDAAVLDLPVYTPATSEAFATYGVIDQGAVAQPLEAPTGVFSQYGGLEISTSSTALQALTDAVLYLVSYPYECSEQLASRILAVAALRDVLTAFNAEGLPSPQAMEAAVQRDLDLLNTIQNDDGGFPYWRRGQETIPFNTIHVAHALARAESKGFTLPEGMQARVLEYLRQIENYYPSYYDNETRRTLSAYTLYVRNLMGDPDPQKALRIIGDQGVENLSLDTVGWLWPVLQDAPGASEQLAQIRRYVTNRAVETAGAANFTNQYNDQNYLLLGSDRRTDAILLDALIGDNPQHDLIPKVVNGLLAQRTRGRWMNTQENVFVLLALDRYFNTFESQTPDFVARIWLGQTYAGSHEFRGRTTDRKETSIPMEYLVNPDLGGGGTQDLILSKEGDGRLYYRLGLRYAPTNLRLDALDMGFLVRRSYEAVDNPEDVRQDSDGVWHVRAGARVRVRLTLEAANRRYHVALVDRLPAGLEIINASLAVSGGLPVDPSQPESRSFWWWGPWYQHQNLRDERAEAFTTLLWEGAYEYTYVTRATTPGTFVVPPAKAEEMYSPEVFGRSAGDILIVE